MQTMVVAGSRWVSVAKIVASVASSSADGRLVQEQPVRAVQQRARDGQPLLLAAAKLHAPVLLLVQPVGEGASLTAVSASRIAASSKAPGPAG